MIADQRTSASERQASRKERCIGTPTARGASAPASHHDVLGIVPPTGGETEFADMYEAYDNLPGDEEEDRGQARDPQSRFLAHTPPREDPMTAEQKAKVPPIAHPIVPPIGDRRKAIFLAITRRKSRHGLRRRPRADRGAQRADHAQERVYTHV